MVSIPTPAVHAFEVDAILVQCAVNVVVSIPALFRADFIHRLIVCLSTALCGFLVETQSFVVDSCLNNFVLCMYSVSVVSGHNEMSVLYFNILSELDIEPGRDVLIGVVVWNVMESWQIEHLFKSISWMLWALCPEESATSVTALTVKVGSDRFCVGTRFFIKCNKTFTSHVFVYFGFGVRMLNIPFINLFVSGASPQRLFPGTSTTVSSAALAVLMELKEYP